MDPSQAFLIFVYLRRLGVFILSRVLRSPSKVSPGGILVVLDVLLRTEQRMIK